VKCIGGDGWSGGMVSDWGAEFFVFSSVIGILDGDLLLVMPL
jgi:hypothetical protein